MIFVNLQLKVKNGLESKFIEELNIILKETRSYEGCHAVYFIQNQDDPSNLEFFSKWDSKQHYDNYLQWRIDSGVMEEVANKYLDGEPLWRYFDLVSEF
ncbi:antibiotic biosynthesis monooxygenase [bacterium]|jgi:quinol monooxygenase YgiN|nr:antibiotic biosynthesis monooxygenase [bacterium]MDB4398203.1 antibiotic biosynthesis monooxygenase [Akkermansiaceae bacterium]MDB4666911.1 antibiotic biosynthesis monooxygenase [bacterium]